MKHTEHKPKASSPRTGVFATLRTPLRATGTCAPSHWSARFAVVLLAAALVLLAVAPSATALLTRARTATFGPDGTSATSFNQLRLGKLAFDQVNNRLYALETERDEVKIHAFNVPTLTLPGGGFPIHVADRDPGQVTDIAVDNTAGDSAGNIYFIAEQDGNGFVTGKIFGYDSTGSELGGNFPIFPPQDKKFVCGGAVDSAGNIFVGDFLAEAVRKYDSNGNSLGVIDASNQGNGHPCGLAFDSNDDLYVAQYRGAVYKYTAVSSYTDAILIDPGNAEAVEVDTAKHQIYVTHPDKVSTYKSDGTFLYDFAAGIPLEELKDATVNEDDDRVYVSDMGNKKIHVFGPAAEYPGVTIAAPTGISSTTATLNGILNPGGAALTDCHFEYVTESAFGATGFTDLSSGGSVPCDPDFGSIPADTSDHAVDAAISGLSQGGQYRYQLVGANVNGVLPSSPESLTTAMAVVAKPASGLTATTAILNGTVNPEGAALTDCHFEYVTESAFGATGFTDLSSGGSVPCDPDFGSIPADTSDHAVDAAISGLVPQGAKYRFRLVAANAKWTLDSVASLATPAGVVTEPATSIGGTTATLNGTVNPDGVGVTDCHFEYLTDAAFQADLADEIQVVTLAGATGGSFTLTFKNFTTKPMPYDAAPTFVRFALERLSSIGADGLEVTGDPGGPYTIAFKNSLAHADLPLLSADSSALQPSGVAAVTPATVTNGSDGYVTATAAPCTPTGAGIGSGVDPVAVHTDLSGLNISTIYHFRLLATYASGPAIRGSDEVVQTLGPLIRDTWVEDIGYFKATLKALINPQGTATTYHFEYGDQGPCDLNPCASTPELAVGSDSADHAVSAPLEGLQAGATYHFRVVATNSDAVNESPDLSFPTFAPVPPATDCPNQTFRVGPAATLPDCRAYEMVSPADKNFGDVDQTIDAAAKAAASRDGQSVGFCTTAIFGDPPGQMPIACAAYISRRGPDGWQTTSPFPRYCRNDTGSGQFGDLKAILSPNFDSAFVMKPESASCPIPPLDPAAPEAQNLYREDFTADPPNYDLLATQIADSGSNSGSTTNLATVGGFSGASEDYSHVVYQSFVNQTDPPDSPSAGQFLKIYDWHDGSLGLVSKDTNEDPFTTPSSIPDKPVQTFTPATSAVSSNGERIFFQNRVSHSDNHNPNGRCYSPACDLYMRENGIATYHVSASECTASCGLSSADVFSWATPEGNKAFFLSCAKLTDNSTAGSPCEPLVVGQEGSDLGSPSLKLYRWDRDAAPGRRLVDLSIDHEPGDNAQPFIQGLIGASTDGNVAYFVNKGQLVSGAPTGSGSKLYRWRWNAGSPAVDYLGPYQTLFTGGAGTFVGEENMAQEHRQVTPDGKYLMIRTKLALDSGADRDTDLDVYRWDEVSGWTCISCQIPGVPSTGGAGLLAPRLSDAATSFEPTVLISDDGQRVFFTTPDALRPEDVNGIEDAYEWHGGAVSLISSGTGDDPVQLIGSTGSGNDVFFITRDRLVGFDIDESTDIYDARVTGGFAEPPTEPPCDLTAGACEGAATAAPAPTGAGSAAFQGPGNPSVRSKPSKQRRCPKGKRKVRSQGKARCVNHRNANHNRRAPR